MTDNETIAEFLGLPLTKEVPMFTGGWKKEPFQNWKYDKEFDWLMPVWYKFKDLEVPNNMYAQFYRKREMIQNAILHQGPTPAEAFRLLAEGIRWYNTINKAQ